MTEPGNENTQQSKSPATSKAAYGFTTLCLVVGVVVGIMIGEVAMGVAAGVGIGLLIPSIYARTRNRARANQSSD